MIFNLKHKIEPAEDQMSTSSLSQNELDNDENQQNHQSVQYQISSNSLTSSSSSSCSLFEVVPLSVNNNLNDLTKDTITQELELKKSDLKLNFKETNTPRTTTFAKLAAAATPTSQSTLGTSNSSNKLNVTISPNNNANANTNSNLISKLSHLTNDKFDSILKEFENNIFILDQIYNQVSSKSLDANKLLQEKTTSMLQNSSPHETIHFMQSINIAVTPIVKQFGSMMANNSKLNVNVNTLSNSNVVDAKIMDTDLEIA